MSNLISHKILRARDRLWTGISSLNTSLLKRLGKEFLPALYYIIPEADWVTDWVGRYITREIHQQFNLRAVLTSAPESLSGQMIHYGEVGTYLNTLGKHATARISSSRRYFTVCTAVNSQTYHYKLKNFYSMPIFQRVSSLHVS